ncbi:aminotransferase class I/II-fold pyridoxal phosphate-dependent enzyme [Nesterenkonia alba]|uniref:aminotransferase class I/II-fold pyridoxal phosphate-dependent enzyme n=1 Tax=Nesterenkonia alba TaxID=515814 RepID=UPI0003B40343|nr:PLP-dependent aminotransferase family protein [Nesterenkonia alba]
MSEIDAVALAERLGTRTPGGIAQQIHQLVDDGVLSPGTRLPTVRDLAQEIGVSVGTIAQAWAQLRADGVVETRRRGGTRVLERAEAGGEFPGFARIDVFAGSPDPALLPDLQEAAAAALKHPSINTWSREHLAAELWEAVASDVPFTPEAAVAAGGGAEGLWLAVRAAVEPGELLAVETPASPGVLELITRLGAEVVEVDTDESGPTPAAVGEAVDAGARALVTSPAGAFSWRHRLTAERAAELGQVLAGTGVIVVEDDPLGPLAEPPAVSVGESLPEQTLRVVDYGRVFGVDLRTSILAGSERLIDRTVELRAQGLGSHSRILQHMLAHLASSADQRRQVASARRRYQRRRTLALEAFVRAGLEVSSGPGSWSVWVEVPDEQKAALALSAEGIVVDVAGSCYPSPPGWSAVRIAVAHLPEDDQLLDQLAARVKAATVTAPRPSLV